MRFDVKVKCVFSTPWRAASLLPGNSLVFKAVPFLGSNRPPNALCSLLERFLGWFSPTASTVQPPPLSEYLQGMPLK